MIRRIEGAELIAKKWRIEGWWLAQVLEFHVPSEISWGDEVRHVLASALAELSRDMVNPVSRTGHAPIRQC